MGSGARFWFCRLRLSIWTVRARMNAPRVHAEYATQAEQYIMMGLEDTINKRFSEIQDKAIEAIASEVRISPLVCGPPTASLRVCDICQSILPFCSGTLPSCRAGMEAADIACGVYVRALLSPTGQHDWHNRHHCVVRGHGGWPRCFLTCHCGGLEVRPPARDVAEALFFVFTNCGVQSCFY